MPRKNVSKTKKESGRKPNLATDKIADLEKNSTDPTDEFLTTNQGTRVNDNQNSLKAGERGPSLLEDFILREKITHFDHERIPERVVHARGAAAHGFFQVYDSLAAFTKASFLQDPRTKTPVFVRFSTVAGSRGSSDLARDVRGFAVKFYTDQGVFDLVGNNIPIFFIQDAVKFPDLIHAVKPEPHHEIPQAASAHDTFWDFISLMPESMHMILWVMSDRAIPRSFRLMEGFGIHTFRLIDSKGKSRFVKFHWKPVLGMQSVAWDEALKISGKDPDFHRRDLWESIESGNFPEWELGLQIVNEEDEFKFQFDLLDPTKIIPEELVPVLKVGKLTLNRNPDNFFAETEQVAFHPGHVVPGIDFTNDPLLQGRLFSYTDTQLTRLGGPNFHEIPINRSVSPVHNNQRDGHMRQTINRIGTSYEPNTISGGCPFQAGIASGGFVSHAEQIDAKKVRGRSPSFFDHFSQATLFYNSQSEAEKGHIVSAFRFELGKVERVAIRERMISLLTQVDQNLAERVAAGLGLPAVSKLDGPMNRSIPADGNEKKFQPVKVELSIKDSPALSIDRAPKKGIQTKKIAIIAADGCDGKAIAEMKQSLSEAGATVKIIAPRLGFVRASSKDRVAVDQSLLTSSSVLYDAVFVPGGKDSIATLRCSINAAEFIADAYRHCKTVGASAEGTELVAAFCANLKLERKDPAKLGNFLLEEGVLFTSATPTRKFAAAFIQALEAQRHWNREKKLQPQE